MTLAERVKALEDENAKLKTRINNIIRRMKRLHEREPYEVPDPDTGNPRRFKPSMSIGKIKYRMPDIVGGQSYYVMVLEEVTE